MWKTALTKQLEHACSVVAFQRPQACQQKKTFKDQVCLSAMGQSYEPIPFKNRLCLSSNPSNFNTTNRHICCPLASKRNRMQFCIKSADFRSKDDRAAGLPDFDVF